ncbi:hypothetical protein [Limibacillus sp. MBR-115]|jgi:hypothetical protein|uniref:hypothetical protein n=1 Tax=Limibacillus sp. MBR-115 TaxID=3156465 RepID=UPI003393BE56
MSDDKNAEIFDGFRFLGALILFTATSAMFFALSPAMLNHHDEGIILTRALRVAAGEVPSRDFYTSYGPAQFYILHWVTALFGQNANVARAYDAIVASGIIFAGLALLRDHPYRSTKVILYFTFATLLITYRFALYPLNLSTLFLVLICHQQNLFMRQTGDLRRGIEVGLLVVLGFLTRYDVGIASFVLVLGSHCLLFLNNRLSWGSFISVPGEELLKALSIQVSFLLLSCLGLYQVGILAPALQDILVYNATIYTEMRALPFPRFFGPEAQPLAAILVVLPPLTLLFSSTYLLSAFFRGRLGEHRDAFLIVLLTASVLLFFGKAWVRTSEVHALPAILLSVVLLLLIIVPSQRSSALGWLRWRWYSLTASSIMALLLLALSTWKLPMRPPIAIYLGAPDTAVRISSIGLFKRPLQDLEAAAYVARHTRDSDRIFSAVGRHDKIFVNNVAFYYLAQRLPATRWYYFDPGVLTSAEVQTQIIAELLKERPPIVVRDSRWDDAQEPNPSAVSSGVVLLDEFIDQNYREVKRFGTITVLKPIDH